MSLSLYLDSSVPSALLDPRNPERQAMTREFWGRVGEFDVFSSEVMTDEINETQDAARRAELLDLVKAIRLVPLTEQMRELASRYVQLGVFSPGDVNDALHTAAAVAGGADILVSWNFRHLVNRRSRGLINSIGMQVGYPSIEILSPPEI